MALGNNDVSYDFNLPLAAYSFIDLDINDRVVPTISLNPNLYIFQLRSNSNTMPDLSKCLFAN